MDNQERFHRLRDDLDRQAQRFEGAAAQQMAHDAADESGAIKVRVGADGGLEHVLIRESWRTEYEPQALGAAVVQVYTAAGAKGLQAWSSALDDEEAGDRARPAPSPPETVAGRLAQIMDDAPPDSAAITTSMDGLVGMLREMNAGLDEAIGMVTDRAQQEHTGRSSSGAVTVTVDTFGGLTGVDYDPGWLTNRHAFNISRETLEAAAAARRTAAVAAPADSLEGTPIADVVRTAQDPRALAERLGLLR